MTDNCVGVISEKLLQLGLSLTESEHKALIKEMRRQIKFRPILSKADEDRAFNKALDVINQMRMQARQAKREALLRMVRRKSLNEDIAKYSQGEIVDLFGSFRKLSQSDREAQAYQASLLGSSQFVTGARDSAASGVDSLTQANVSALISGLKKKGDHLESALRKGTYDEQLFIYAMNREADVPQDVKDIFDVIDGVLNGLRERKNRAGSFIGRLEGFLVRQQHDSELIKKTNFNEYKDDFLRLVDRDKTFGEGASAADIDEVVLDLYNRFSAGSHYKVDPGDEGLPSTGQGMNLAKRLSQKRQIHFADGAKAAEYAKKYSRGSVFDKVINHLEHDAKTVTLLEKFGPNPKAMHEQIKQDIVVRAQQRGETVSDGRLKALDSSFAKLNGELDIPGSHSLAHVGFSLRALESMSKLGGAVLSAFPDIVLKGATLNRMTDMGFFESYITAFRGALGRLPAGEREFFAEMTGVYSDTALGSAYRRAGAIDGMPGRVAGLQELFFRINLLQGWTVNNKAGVVSAFTYYLGKFRNTDFDALPPKTRRTLELFNIDAEDWSLVRHMETLESSSGKNFVTEGGVASIPDEIIDAAISRRMGITDVTDTIRQSFKDGLSSKFRTMNYDFAESAVVTPGKREQVLMTLGTQKGTVLGEFVRMVTQFKAFPVTVISKQLLPEYYAAGGGARGAAALVPMMVLATGFGYLSGAAKDLAKGREPRDPTNPDTWKDAMLRGGGLGLFGDFMFAEYSRFGRSFQEELFGPGLNTIGDTLALAHRAATTDGVDAGDVFRQVKAITPGANLFYTEAAFNYLFFYGLMESYDPGYLARMQRIRERDFEQDFWLSPSASAVRFD